MNDIEIFGQECSLDTAQRLSAWLDDPNGKVFWKFIDEQKSAYHAMAGGEMTDVMDLFRRERNLAYEKAMDAVSQFPSDVRTIVADFAKDRNKEIAKNS